MKARFTALFATVLLTLSSTAFAVGLGELTMQSHLNEPLKARIALVKTGDLKEGELLVAMATAEEFAKHNMSRDAIYGTVHFELDMNNTAGPSILLSTQAVIKEPTLDFLVSLSWPTGKIVRGYTVLLEKP
ncbi:MAG TPA: hypothetical protein VLB90_01810 [Pseudomonadales bacterium]|nr:hypothetical protein [Pseudomonadales bacterium]